MMMMRTKSIVEKVVMMFYLMVDAVMLLGEGTWFCFYRLYDDVVDVEHDEKKIRR